MNAEEFHAPIAGQLEVPTDRQRLEQLLADFGIEPSRVDKYGHELESGDLQLLAKHGGVDGYWGFVADWIFDEDGKFVSVGVWE